MKCQVRVETRRKPRVSKKEKKAARKAAKKKNKKEQFKSPLLSMFENDDNVWDSVPTPEDMFETTKSQFLHETDIMYGYQYGVDLDAFMKQIDSLKEFQVIHELTTTGVIQQRFRRYSLSNQQQRACIAAAQLSKTLPCCMDPTLSVEELAELKLSSEEMVQLTRKRSAYFSNKEDDVPIVIDTGASLSVSPFESDFVSNIRPTETDDLQGLSGATEVKGRGKVRWTIRDVFGSVRIIETEAYYVPRASIRLFSPQRYFQEQDAGEYWCDSQRSVLTLADGSSLEFPYNPGSNLPLMLPDQREPMCFTFEEAATLRSNTRSVFMSVADEMNQNLTSSQRELLKWHWRLGHANFSWIQRLAAQPRKSPEGRNEPILRTKTEGVSSCSTPLCAACQMSKQTQTNPEVRVDLPIPEKEMALKRSNLEPGDMVSIDQYVSTVPGRLPKTKGKEPKSKKYTGGTLFVDHATGYIYLHNQVSLKVGETLQGK